jgi:hypothetical protein
MFIEMDVARSLLRVGTILDGRWVRWIRLGPNVEPSRSRSSSVLPLSAYLRRLSWSNPPTMKLDGASFLPEDIVLMRAVLDAAADRLPLHKRTSAMKAHGRAHSSGAASGERDPIRLQAAALLAMADSANENHNISPGCGLHSPLLT